MTKGKGTGFEIFADVLSALDLTFFAPVAVFPYFVRIVDRFLPAVISFQ